MKDQFFILIRLNVDPKVFPKVQHLLLDLAELLKGLLIILYVVHLVRIHRFDLPLYFVIGADEDAATRDTGLGRDLAQASVLRGPRRAHLPAHDICSRL